MSSGRRCNKQISTVLAMEPAQQQGGVARPTETRQRMQEVPREMGRLESDLKQWPPSFQEQHHPALLVTNPFESPGDEQHTTVGGARAQMMRMQQEIDSLKQSQSSDGAKGLTHEAPPGYAPPSNFSRASGD